jgi:hypothetical protein
MNLDAILASSPINQTAARVVSRRRGIEEPTNMAREEIVALKARLERKQRLLKRVLGITTKAQHKNLVYRMNTGRMMLTERGKNEPRSALEYKLVGEQIQRLNVRLSELRAERRAVAMAERV